MRVLDIGCGWGGFARHAAETARRRGGGHHRFQGAGELARELCRGLPVEIRLQDYRDVDGSFDRIVSIGMIEHVGVKNYRRYMQVGTRCLGPDGLFLLHTIGEQHLRRARWTRGADKYIFPNCMLPSMRQLAAAAEGLFVIEDWHSFGRTTTDAHGVERQLRRGLGAAPERYGERFFRMWRYYLLASAGSFRARSNQLWQIVFSAGGLRGGYRPSGGRRTRRVQERWNTEGAGSGFGVQPVFGIKGSVFRNEKGFQTGCDFV